jgi:hypothetical protein
MLRQDNIAMPDIDHTGWEKEFSYAAQDPNAKLQEFLGERQMTIDLVHSAGGDALSRKGIHSVRGPMTFADVVQYFIDHTRTHVRQINRTLKETGAQSHEK